MYRKILWDIQYTIVFDNILNQNTCLNRKTEYYSGKFDELACIMFVSFKLEGILNYFKFK